jgi:hypothetical protein
MADKTDKWPENTTGKFYVDQQCIDCDLCRETAPDFFTRDDDGGFSYVMMTAGFPTSMRNRRTTTMRRFAWRRWKVARWRQLGTMGIERAAAEVGFRLLGDTPGQGRRKAFGCA